jgi:hypothetical protein
MCSSFVAIYIRESTALRTLILNDNGWDFDDSDMWWVPVNARLAGLFFQAARSSTSIEELNVEQWEY